MTGSLVSALQPISWPTLALVSARAAGLVLIAPLWSLAAIPPSIRGAIAMLLAFAVLPSVTPVADGDLLIIAAAGELLVGLAIGLSGAVLAHGMAIAAEVVSLQMGLSLGAAISPGSDLGTGGIGELKMLLTLVIYATIGGHLALVEAFARSFDSIPAGAAPNLIEGGRAAVALAGTVFDVAIRAAAPAMVALLVTNLALALLSRAVPQLNAMMVAIPVTICVGILALGAALPSLAEWIAGEAAGAGAKADHLIRAFAPAVAR
jgi:flagellar biosynthetic protein FliR